MRLEEISLEHMNAFIAMIADYEANDPEGFKELYARKRKWDAAEFRAFVKECEKERLDWRPGPNKVSVTRFVLLDEQRQILGNGIMRFPLTDKTNYEGGNLSFDVPPSQRGGHNEAYVLNKMLFEAVRAGMARVLVTCYSDDQAAQQAIEMNRGEFEDEVCSEIKKGKKVRRYWIKFR